MLVDFRTNSDYGYVISSLKFLNLETFKLEFNTTNLTEIQTLSDQLLNKQIDFNSVGSNYTITNTSDILNKELKKTIFSTSNYNRIEGFVNNTQNFISTDATKYTGLFYGIKKSSKDFELVCCFIYSPETLPVRTPPYEYILRYMPYREYIYGKNNPEDGWTYITNFWDIMEGELFGYDISGIEYDLFASESILPVGVDFDTEFYSTTRTPEELGSTFNYYKTKIYKTSLHIMNPSKVYNRFFSPNTRRYPVGTMTDVYVLTIPEEGDAENLLLIAPQNDSQINAMIDICHSDIFKIENKLNSLLAYFRPLI